MSKKRVHVWISGRVHGVFFRAFTRDVAERAGVGGWVRNLRDSRVEAVFEGEENNVRQVIDWCRRGSPLSRVDDVEVIEEPYVGEFASFSITH